MGTTDCQRSALVYILQLHVKFSVVRSKEDWLPPFLDCPAWPCPSCQKSNLRSVENSLKECETGASRAAKNHEAWEPDWTKERFTTLFQCTDDKCGEVVTCVGDVSVKEIIEYEGGSPSAYYKKFYTPLYFYPPLRFFTNPAECPDAITAHIDRAFATAWSDSASTVNAMRAALEAILSDKDVPRTTINNKRKRVPVSLHSRIERYASIDTDIKDLLMGLKWLGNNGSHAHGKPLKIKDLLSGFEVFEHLLDHIYTRRARRINKIAKELVRRCGKPR